jgi:hypothetical protein
MPRRGYQKRTPLWPLALSKSDAAKALGISVRAIDMALAAGELEMFTPNSGLRRGRILTESLVSWVKNYWRKSNG